MVQYIFVVSISISIMVAFAFFVMKNIINRINDNTRKYFMDKLQDYDYVIDEKKELLSKLEKDLMTLEDEKEIKLEIEEYKKHKKEIDRQLMQSNFKEAPKGEKIYDIPIPKYKQEEFFKSYKKLKKDFKIDVKKIIKEFIAKHEDVSQNEINEKLLEIRGYFREDAIYEILTLSSSDQYKLVKEALSKADLELIKFDDIDKKNFSILNLIEKIDEGIKETDPTIYVYVSDDADNYDDLGEHIKTVKYKNMSEGIIIQYHNKMYDYSI